MIWELTVLIISSCLPLVGIALAIDWELFWMRRIVLTWLGLRIICIKVSTWLYISVLSAVFLSWLAVRGFVTGTWISCCTMLMMICYYIESWFSVDKNYVQYPLAFLMESERREIGLHQERTRTLSQTAAFEHHLTPCFA
jgi:hypothetical protein